MILYTLRIQQGASKIRLLQLHLPAHVQYVHKIFTSLRSHEGDVDFLERDIESQ